jgi:hypothetical protein
VILLAGFAFTAGAGDVVSGSTDSRATNYVVLTVGSGDSIWSIARTVADGRDVGSTAAADIYLQGSVAAALDPAANSNQGSIASELAYLIPLFEHNPLG